MADRYWPGESALGKRFRFFGMEPVEVVGVAEVVKYQNPGEERAALRLPAAARSTTSPA